MAKIKPSSLSPTSKSSKSRIRMPSVRSPMHMYGLEDLYRIHQTCEDIKKEVDGMRNHFIKWFGDKESGGGLLSYRMATDLAAYIKAELIANKSIPDPATPLDPWWKKVKEEYHPSNSNKLGVASGLLANSIKATKAGGRSGRWAVTVSGRYPSVPGYKGGGKIKDVGVIGSLLEFGMEEFDADPGLGGGESLFRAKKKPPTKTKSTSFKQRKKSTHVQPPRPWFFPAFHNYMEEKMPDLVDRLFLNKFNEYYKRLAKATTVDDKGLSKYKPVEPEDIVDYGEDDRSGMSEIESVMAEEEERGVRFGGAESGLGGLSTDFDSILETEDVGQFTVTEMQKGGETIGYAVWDIFTGAEKQFTTLKEAVDFINKHETK